MVYSCTYCICIVCKYVTLNASSSTILYHHRQLLMYHHRQLLTERLGCRTLYLDISRRLIQSQPILAIHLGPVDSSGGREKAWALPVYVEVCRMYFQSSQQDIHTLRERQSCMRTEWNRFGPRSHLTTLAGGLNEEASKARPRNLLSNTFHRCQHGQT